MATEWKSPKNSSKYKVASIFNFKTKQRDVGKYSNLDTEFLTEPKQQAIEAAMKPTPIKTTPFPKRKVKASLRRTELSGCFESKTVFAKLPVKEKLQLYRQFVEEITKKNPKFAFIELRNTSIDNVENKHDLEELKRNKFYPKPTVTAAIDVQRIDFMKGTCAVRKNSPFKVFKDIFNSHGTTHQQKATYLPRLQIFGNFETASFEDDEQNKDFIFQNPEIEDLFFSWFKEKTGNNNQNHHDDDSLESDNDKQNSTSDTLLEEVKFINEVEYDRPTPSKLTEKSTISTTTVKTLESEESESGLSSLTKTSGEESQVENTQQAKISKSENNFEIRKKRFRNSPARKREDNQTSSTDIESSDNKKAEIKPKGMLNEAAAPQSELEASLMELNQSFMKLMNSPRKVKAAYTLTINDLETSFYTPRKPKNFAKRFEVNRQYSNDILIGNGFDTTANVIDSPVKTTSLQENREIARSQISPILNSNKNVKTNRGCSFANTNSSKKSLFCPISKQVTPQKSFYNVDSRGNSLLKQTSRGDLPFHPQETTSSTIYRQRERPKEDKISKFWIKCQDFSLDFEINYIGRGRLHLLHEMFCKTICATKHIHFGINNHTFSLQESLNRTTTSIHMPSTKEGSTHYWFSNGNLLIPFNGKYLASQKIQRIFCLIKETIKETGNLRFGVDNVEFSYLPKSPQVPRECQYSKLGSLKTGASERDSKCVSAHSKSGMGPDLEQSNNESGAYAFFTPSQTNYYDVFSLDNDPSDQLFADSSVQKDQTQLNPIPEIIRSSNYKKECSSIMRDQSPSNYGKPKTSFPTKDSLDALVGTPEYGEKLKDIVSDISNVSNNLKEFSVEELESCMHFLNRYAEICLKNCDIDKILDALADCRETAVIHL